MREIYRGADRAYAKLPTADNNPEIERYGNEDTCIPLFTVPVSLQSCVELYPASRQLYSPVAVVVYHELVRKHKQPVSACVTDKYTLRTLILQVERRQTIRSNDNFQLDRHASYYAQQQFDSNFRATEVLESGENLAAIQKLRCSLGFNAWNEGNCIYIERRIHFSSRSMC